MRQTTVKSVERKSVVAVRVYGCALCHIQFPVISLKFDRDYDFYEDLWMPWTGLLVNFPHISYFYSISLLGLELKWLAGWFCTCLLFMFNVHVPLERVIRMLKTQKDPLRKAIIMEPFTCSIWYDDTLLGIIWPNMKVIWMLREKERKKWRAQGKKGIAKVNIMRVHVCMFCMYVNCGWCACYN